MFEFVILRKQRHQITLEEEVFKHASEMESILSGISATLKLCEFFFFLNVFPIATFNH